MESKPEWMMVILEQDSLGLVVEAYKDWLMVECSMLARAARVARVAGGRRSGR
jgi:hypothetical protein